MGPPCTNVDIPPQRILPRFLRLPQPPRTLGRALGILVESSYKMGRVVLFCCPGTSKVGYLDGGFNLIFFTENPNSKGYLFQKKSTGFGQTSPSV